MIRPRKIDRGLADDRADKPVGLGTHQRRRKIELFVAAEANLISRSCGQSRKFSGDGVWRGLMDFDVAFGARHGCRFGEQQSQVFDHFGRVADGGFAIDVSAECFDRDRWRYALDRIGLGFVQLSHELANLRR